VILDPPGVVGAGTAVADTISIDTGSTPAGSAGDIAFNGTLDAELAGADHLRVTAFDGAAAFGNVTFGDGGGTDDVGGSFSARMGDITIVNAAAVTLKRTPRSPPPHGRRAPAAVSSVSGRPWT
jgi:hypothetical protein